MDSLRVNALAIITHNNKLLVQKYEDKVTGVIFCRILGGGVELGELSADALKREMKEEIGAEIENEKLLKVVENVFTLDGKLMHEITFLYMANLVGDEFFNKEKVEILDKKDKYAEWLEIEDIKSRRITLYPEEATSFL
jgi:ADP-ribose pyrophosphatase YjhB (NUDIX family)